MRRPLVIAHRGASGYCPEHTLESYRLGAEQGADYIEPDLVITSDGVLVARHENEIAGTTDVADHPELADRRTTKVVDGRPHAGWFTEDLTLAELKTLRVRERIPDLRPRNTADDGRFEVPTFAEVLELRDQLCAELGREIGVYPETKHPTYFRDAGLPLEEAMLADLAAAGLDRRGAPVLLQSFEAGNLRALRERTSLPLVKLAGLRDGTLPTPDDLRQVAEYADAVGPAKELLAEAPSFVEHAHAAGLEVHPYTFRRENAFLPRELRSSEDPAAPGDLAAELRRYYDLGVDGVFTDNPDIAVAARG